VARVRDHRSGEHEREVRVKQLVFFAIPAEIGSALVLGAAVASAQTVVAENPTHLQGTDTFNRTMDQLLVALRASGAVSPLGSGGVDVYAGPGSSCAERAMEGSPASTEDTCGPNDGNGLPENNPGCQEIAPLSRPMDNSICEDDNAAANAEALQVCQDAVVLLARNAGYGQYGESAEACTNYQAASNNNASTSNDPVSGKPVFDAYDGVGNWRDSGTLDLDPAGSGPEDYAIGANGLGWRDIARIVYTGFDNDDGNGSAAAGGEQNRLTRCSSPLRQKVLSQWSNLNQGVACSEGPCTDVIRALRRDDSSGATQFFVEMLGLAPMLTGTRTALNSLGACTRPVTNFTFCDGGDQEVNFPTDDTSTATLDCNGTRGDPIKKACCPEEDICDRDGQMGVVVAVRSPLENLAQSFPLYQCSRNLFARLDYQATSQAMCPDGTKPLAGRCRFPFYNNNGVKDFNCLNVRNSQPPQLPVGSVDGRVYNTVVRTSAGVVLKRSTGNMPESATWRYNQSVLNPGIVSMPLMPVVCQQADATSLIGCAVANTNCCTIGFAGRDAATLQLTPTSTMRSPDDGNEPFRIAGFSPSNSALNQEQYPIRRTIDIAALNGFENITADCTAAGHDPDYCEDELAIAEAYFDLDNYLPGAAVFNACVAGGLIPFEFDPANPTTSGPKCVGTQSSAGCGRPDNQDCGSDRECSRLECIPE